MQQPTCTNTRIRSTQDAHKIFFAVQHGILPLITRRLDADERLALRSGCVYAWEERGSHAEITGLGIERFTEGRRWSPSRVRDEFLFYYEKYTPPHDASQPNSVDRPAPRDWDPLVKQTYSVWVDTPNGRRKWHLTAYFTQATVDQLDTINEIHGVGNLFVPEGLFQSTRTGKNRKSDGEESRTRPKDVFQPSISNNRKYAPFPTPYSGPSTPRLEMPQTSTSPERHHQNDVTQGTSYYHPETQALMPHFSVPPPAAGTHYNLPPLHNPPHSDYESERRLSLPNIHADHNGAHGRYPDTSYHSGSAAVAASQSHVYNETATYSSSPPLHHHAHLRERFVSYPRETQAPSGAEAQPQYGEWQRASPSGSSGSAAYTLRPSYTSTSTTHNYSRSSHSSDFAGNGGYSRSHSPPSEQTSPTTSHSHRSPSSHEYSLADERHVPYETTSSVRTRFPRDGEAENGEGPDRVKLAPLHSLRNHPYRRDPVDDKALRKLRPRAP
ncbi:hypothetical protein PILCRDRAFT_826828 [Piloderma croceum F 1598]|uniref:cAMP-independent regulatory protein pac2 n=1 Tax=Piloderma croceum (strain F 1598) TaxID=765440 RepID=A0A0C3APX6_PILCF|nr:hypothetical protein PILCRDRAFT_826828 [Piloderma croceum F 1598]